MTAKVLAVVATLCYPFVIGFGLQYFGLISLALLLLLVAALRLYTHRDRVTLGLFFISIGLAVLALWNNQLLPLKLYPVAVNVAMLTLFTTSLYQKECIIEKFARLKNPQLSSQAVSYLRKLTKIWCIFFIFNGSIALFTALYTSIQTWTIYNGFIAYLLIGTLLAGEWLFRKTFLKP